MTISGTALRAAMVALVLFALFGCALSVLIPALRGATPTVEGRNLTNWLFWILLVVSWVGIIGAGFLLRPYNRPRSVGLFLAAGLIPLLLGFYYFLIAFSRAL